MSKKGIAKVVAGAVFVGGITFAGVNYTGSDSINNITNKATELQGRFNEAVADLTYLQGEFNELNTLYKDDMAKANGEISSLKDTAVGFKQQIRALQAELEAGNTDNTTAQEEIQAEVTRLENALTEANTDIADLEAYILQLEADTQYEPINREEYEANDLGTSYTADFISLDAYELDQGTATLYAQNAHEMMEAFNTDFSEPMEITGVGTAVFEGETVISYKVPAGFIGKLSSLTNQNRHNMDQSLVALANYPDVQRVYFSSSDTVKVGFIQENGWYVRPL